MPIQHQTSSMIVRLQRLLNASPNHIAGRGAIVFMTQILGLLLGFGTQIYIARMVGSFHYGIHAYVISWMVVLLLPAVFGMDTTVLRFTSEYREDGSLAKLLGLGSSAKRFVALASIAVVVLTAGVLGILTAYSAITTGVIICFSVGLVSIPLDAQLSVSTAQLKGIRKPVLSSLLTNCLRPILTAILLFGICYFFVRDDPTSLESMSAYTLSTFAVALVGSGVVRFVRYESVVEDVEPKYDNSLWLRTALPLVLTSGFRVVIRRSDVIMVGLMVGFAEAGYYSAAARMVALTGFGLKATNAVVAPLIAAAHSRSDYRELSRHVQSGAKTVFLMTIPLVAGLVLLGRWGLQLFGPGFTEAYGALLILCGGQLVNALCGCVGFLLTMTGNERVAAKIVFCASLSNLLLNAILIPSLGLLGAACATALTTVLWNVWMLVEVRKRLRVNPTITSCMMADRS